MPNLAYTVSYLIEMIAPWKGGQTQPLVNTQIAMLDAKRHVQSSNIRVQIKQLC